MEKYNLELMELKHNIRCILFNVNKDREKLKLINDLVNK